MLLSFLPFPPFISDSGVRTMERELRTVPHDVEFVRSELQRRRKGESMCSFRSGGRCRDQSTSTDIVQPENPFADLNASLFAFASELDLGPGAQPALEALVNLNRAMVGLLRQTKSTSSSPADTAITATVAAPDTATASVAAPDASPAAASGDIVTAGSTTTVATAAVATAPDATHAATTDATADTNNNKQMKGDAVSDDVTVLPAPPRTVDERLAFRRETPRDKRPKSTEASPCDAPRAGRDAAEDAFMESVGEEVNKEE